LFAKQALTPNRVYFEEQSRLIADEELRWLYRRGVPQAREAMESSSRQKTRRSRHPEF
jgi:hypothetical protein